MSIDAIILSQTTAIQQQQARLLGDEQALQFLLAPGLTAAALQAWYVTAGNAQRFAALLQAPLGVDLLVANDACMAAILGSASAVAALVASNMALLRVFSSRSALMALLNSASAATAIRANATAQAQLRAFTPAGVAASVPTMTSNSSPSGAIIASGIYNETWDSYYAFDKNKSSGWMPPGATGWISYRFTKPVWVHTVTFASAAGTDGIRQFAVDSSNDGNTWAEELTGIAAASDGMQEFNFVPTKLASWWRLRIVTNGGFTSYTRLWELDFKGIA